MENVFLLNKPVGMTSFQAVNQARKILHLKKTGHTGTLDPNASGLLIVLGNEKAKLVPYCIKDHKKYRATIRLGIKTDSGDITGNLIAKKEVREHTQEEINRIVSSFIGTIEQVPPMYSALKVDGQKLVDLARKGKEVERKPRTVTIHALSIQRVQADLYTLDAEVSSGTYIRTLAEDVLKALGEYGTLETLQRYAISSLTLQEANTLEDLSSGNVHWIADSRIIDETWPLVDAKDHEDDILHGRTFDLESDHEQMIFTKGEILLAAYAKQKDMHYHCVRGLL